MCDALVTLCQIHVNIVTLAAIIMHTICMDVKQELNRLIIIQKRNLSSEKQHYLPYKIFFKTKFFVIMFVRYFVDSKQFKHNYNNESFNGNVKI